MTYYREQYAPLHVVKVVVFCFAGNKSIGPISHGIGNKKCSRTTTERHITNFLSSNLGMADGGQVKNIFQPIEELLLRHRFGQHSHHSTAALRPVVGNGIEVEHRFLVRVYRQQCAQHLFLSHGRNHRFNAYLRLKMQRVYLTHMRVSSRAGAKRTLTRQVIAAAVVVSNVAGAGIKESISHTVSMLDRYGSHKLQQGAPSRLQDLHLLQLQHLRQLVVDTPLCIVEVGVSGINHDILLDGLYDASFHISLPGERLKRSKSNGVMCYDEVAAQGDRFVDHILGDIDA